ncbi:hypothetical protein M3204_03065 [Mesobacillus subterraneus]|jgi:hypothetical protein|uniref:hypothetical protein n=1 Tax=Mesobacillus subterraneus TaxID=285983 RepID=UPI002040F00F|nr:hypothetical protein [Mesobacillus subterraneus]MCM3663370.1 hypothetical protein [Mesobacillus subterraneus]MCM3683141.1 hypothetical protein [Mesobacillus subterraneus]
MQQQNMNFQSQQQGIMQTPPSVVSTKDSLYLTDMLSWNLLAMKKAHFFAGQCQDPELKAEIEKCGQMHQRHYEKILTHLNSPQNQAYTGMQ